MDRITSSPPPVSSAIPALPDGWYVLRPKVLSGSRLALLGANADVRAALRSDQEISLRERVSSNQAWRLAAQTTAKVWIFEGNDLSEAVSFPLLDPFSIVEQFPDGRWLVTKARSDGDESARVLRVDGSEERRIRLGDGIEHIKIDDRRRIWVGWFDEGVGGNDDWRLPGIKWPISAYGIAAFDEQGSLVNHATAAWIQDCYALNVSEGAAWACTYMDFPIWQIGDERERVWPTELSGTSALAVSYPYVLAAGGYRDAANRIVLLRLSDQNVETLGEWRLPFGIGKMNEVRLMDGRDDELHVVHDNQWHRWRVRDFVELID